MNKYFQGKIIYTITYEGGNINEAQQEMMPKTIMKFIATEVNKKKITDKEFVIPEDYQKVTREELMNSPGQCPPAG